MSSEDADSMDIEEFEEEIRDICSDMDDELEEIGQSTANTVWLMTELKKRKMNVASGLGRIYDRYTDLYKDKVVFVIDGRICIMVTMDDLANRNATMVVVRDSTELELY